MNINRRQFLQTGLIGTIGKLLGFKLTKPELIVNNEWIPVEYVDKLIKEYNNKPKELICDMYWLTLSKDDFSEQWCFPLSPEEILLLTNENV